MALPQEYTLPLHGVRVIDLANAPHLEECGFFIELRLTSDMCQDKLARIISAM